MSAASLDAVLPLLAADLERAVLLRESLDRFAGDISTCWVVAPDDQVDQVAEAFAGGRRWQVVGEGEILGRRRRVRFAMFPGGGRPRRGGWYLQQIIKLAACARSEARYCITLDADVIALRPISEREIAPEGRALTQIEPPPQAHPHWYDGSARVLNMPRSPWHHAVTPAVLCPGVCRNLIAYLNARRGPLNRDWISYLMHRAPWSEYSLYNTYLEGVGDFDRYHFRVEGPVLYGDAVWSLADFAGWNGGRIPGQQPLFTLVQSTTGLSVDEVRSRLRDERPADRSA
jgi:hypothetical protein